MFFFHQGYFVAPDDVLLSPPKLHQLYQNKYHIWKYPLKKTYCGHVNKDSNCSQSIQGEIKCQCKSNHPVFLSDKHNKRYTESLEILYNRSVTLGGKYTR